MGLRVNNVSHQKKQQDQQEICQEKPQKLQNRGLGAPYADGCLTPPQNQPPRDPTRRHLKKNAVKMRFYKEFGIFLPKIQNRIEQKYKTKLDNFTKRIVLIGNLSDQLFFWGRD
jgi:hypothetical protein